MDSNSDEPSKPPTLIERILRSFGLRMKLPRTLGELYRKSISLFFYVNFFVFGWFVGYFIAMPIVCIVNIGENIFQKNFTFFEAPTSLFTFASDACGASLVELINIHVFSLIFGFIGIFFVWFIHYSIKYNEYPMFL